jgi:exosortase H (IPTLxxWG-CTERM-specific)
MKKKWRDRLKQHWVILRFGPLFIFIIILFFLLVGHRFFSEKVPLELYFTKGVTQISSIALTLAGIETRADGTELISEDPDAPKANYGIDLKTGCNGLVATLIFIAAILAFPSSLKHKILGVLLGCVIIQGFNVFRIGLLYYLGLHHKTLFETVHIYVAQSILIAIAAALWLIWSAWAGKRPEPKVDGP